MGVPARQETIMMKELFSFISLCTVLGGNEFRRPGSVLSTLEVHRLARKLGCKQGCRTSIDTWDGSHPAVDSEDDVYLKI